MCRSNDEIELNTKNRHNIDALVTGLSFYKPANEQSPHETILSIVNSESNNVVVSLCYRLQPEPVYADLIFIVWIGIYPEYHLQDYAKAALKFLTSELKQQCIRQMALQVFNNYLESVTLYKVCGFEVKRTIMHKHL